MYTRISIFDNSKHGYHVKNKLVALQFVNKFLFSFYDSFVSCYQRNLSAVKKYISSMKFTKNTCSSETFEFFNISNCNLMSIQCDLTDFWKIKIYFYANVLRVCEILFK